MPHHCWNTAMKRPSSNTRPYLPCSNSRSLASFPVRCDIVAAFICKYTGLSGIKKLITKNSAAGTVSAQNIQRHPHSTFHAMFSATLVSLASSILTICAPRIPSTMVIWFRLTIRPRISVGLTSAIYIGDKADATPMPTPPIKRAILNREKSLKRPVPTADKVNSTAAVVKRGFRP